MGKYCHYLCFIDGILRVNLVQGQTKSWSFKPKREGNLRYLFDTSVESKYLLSEWNIHLKKDFRSEFVKIPFMFFLFRRMSSKFEFSWASFSLKRADEEEADMHSSVETTAQG